MIAIWNCCFIGPILKFTILPEINSVQFDKNLTGYLMVNNGFFLVLDGIDGCGKSSQVKLLFDYYKKKKYQVHLTAEPSKGEIGKILRKSLQDDKVPAALDALLFAADRLDHCYREIQPKLNEGFLVISDRYRDSSYIYQTVQAQKKNEDITTEWMKRINEKSINPDLTIILDIDPKISLQRRLSENEQKDNHMEKFEQLEFQKKIRQEFIKMAIENERNVDDKHIIVNASNDKDIIFKEIIKILNKYNIFEVIKNE